MRKRLIGLLVLGVALAAIAVVVPPLIPAEGFRAVLEAGAAARTGRRVTIAGPIRLALVPVPTLHADDVSLHADDTSVAGSSPDGSGGKDQGAPLARIGALEIRLRLLPLVRGRVEVDRVVLVRPVITLDIDGQGVRNWRRPPAAAAAPRMSVPESPDAAPGSAAPALDEIDLEDGRFSLTDRRVGGHAVMLDRIRARVMVPASGGGPATLAGEAVWRGRRLAVTAATPGGAGAVVAALAGGDGDMPITLGLDGDPLSLHFDGTLSGGAGGFRAHGTVDATVPVLPEALAWVGADPGWTRALQVRRVAISGPLEAGPTGVGLTTATVKLDDLTLTGPLAVDVAGSRPRIKGRLTTTRVDVDRLTGGPIAVPAGTVPAGGPVTPSAGASTAPDPGSGASERPIDLAALTAIDLGLTLQPAGVAWRGVDFGATRLDLTLADGRLDAVLGETALFDGTVSARVIADATVTPPAVGADFRINGVHVEPALTRLAAFDRLSGVGRGVLSVQSRGATQAALLGGLSGQGRVTLDDGQLRGIDLAAIAHTVPALRDGLPAGDGAVTDFAALTATVTIAAGIVSTTDLALAAPLVRMSGAGRVDLPAQTVDMRLEPRLVASAAGQDGPAAPAGLGIPILVRGSFQRLTYVPDIADVLRDPAKYRRDLGAVGTALKGTRSEDVLKGAAQQLLNGGGSGKAGDAAAQLKRLFK